MAQAVGPGIILQRCNSAGSGERVVFEGQHGMSLAISSAVAEMGISFAIADIDASEAVPAMTGRKNGASTSPAIMKIASSRRMVI